MFIVLSQEQSEEDERAGDVSVTCIPGATWEDALVTAEADLGPAEFLIMEERQARRLLKDLAKKMGYTVKEVS